MATSNTTPIVIPQPIAAQATSENINVIPNGATGTNKASFQEGFPEITRMPVIENPLPTQKSGLPPTQQDFNGLFNAVSQHNFFAQNGGMYSFNQAVSDAIGGYPKNAVLWYFPENGTPYLVCSLINDNTNNFVEDPTLIDDEHWKRLSFGGSGEIGDIGFAPLGIDESENKRRYLNGQVIIQSQFVSFTNKVKAAIALYPSLATTETNWQAEKNLSKLGQCGKFVVDDTAGTIRLPAVVNAQGLVDLALLGVIKNESLPNLAGEVGYAGDLGMLTGNVTRISGVFKKGSSTTASPTGDSKESFALGFDASGSSATYQDNAPVQQEAVQYPYYIVVNTGVEEAERPINNYQVNNVYSYGMSQYYKGTMNNNSWLRSQGQWNDGNVYTGMYNWLLEQMNAGVSGFVASTAAYTDYDFVINTADQTFRLPLVAGRVLVAKKEATIEDQSWYNLYSDGWIEQGGIVANTGANHVATISLLKPYADTNYVVTTGQENSGGAVSVAAIGQIGAKTTTSFQNYQYHDVIINWCACGYGEVPTASDYPEMPCLYYYVGDTLQNADLINVARIEEKIVDKADADLSNCTKPYVTETWKSGTSWYRIWSDGWIEQGGSVTSNSGLATYNFITPFIDTNYNLLCSQNSGGVGGGSNGMVINRVSATQFSVLFTNDSAGLVYTWRACGY